MKIVEPNFRINNYPMYGLNRYRSFMHAPELEGQPAYMQLEGLDEVAEFCCEVLGEYNCMNAAIFTVFNDGSIRAFIKTYDEEAEEVVIYGMENAQRDPHAFAKIDAELKLCCYTLMIEEEPGKWMINS